MLTPIYKYYEQQGLPYINLAAPRFLLFCLTYVLFVFNLKNVERAHLKYALGFLCFHLLIVVLHIINFQYVKEYAVNIETLYLARIDTVVVNYFMFFLFGMVYSELSKQNKRSLNLFLYILWLPFVAFTIINIDKLSNAYGANILDNSEISYIFFADRIAILSILLFYNEKRSKIKFLTLSISFILLFLFPSRTSFYVFIVSLIIINLLRLNLKKVLTMLIGASLIYLVADGLLDKTQLLNSRIFVVTLENNSSLEVRQDIFENNKDIILDNLVLGDFMSDVRIAGEGGYMIHNFLSMLQELGLVVFIPFLLFVFMGLYDAYFILKQKEVKDEDLALISLLIYALISAIFSRSHLYAYIFIVFMALRQAKNLYIYRFKNKY